MPPFGGQKYKKIKRRKHKRTKKQKITSSFPAHTHAKAVRSHSRLPAADDRQDRSPLRSPGGIFLVEILQYLRPLPSRLGRFSNSLIFNPMQNQEIICRCNLNFMPMKWETDAYVIRVSWA